MPHLTTTATAAPLLAALFAALPVPCQTEAEAPADPPMAPPLVVASFNIRYGTAREDDDRDLWPNRKGHVVRTIRSWRPHVVGLQEALHMQVQYLRDELPGLGFVGQGRDGGTDGEYAGILYDRERLDLVDSGDFWLSETPDEVGSVGWDAALTRIVTWAVFEDRAVRNRRFKIWNTHFDHRGETARTESAKLLAARVRASALPDVVLGDLNAAEDSTALAALRGVGLVDTFRVAFPDTRDAGTMSGWTGRRPDDRGYSRKIDYALCDGGFVPVFAQIDRRTFAGRAPSDHYPVLAHLRWAPERTPRPLDLSDADAVAARRPLRIAHRGGVVAEGSPEGSAEALFRAAAAGYAMVELDVRRAADGAAVVFHDARLEAACGREGRIEDLPADEAAALGYLGSDEHVLTLSTALAASARLGLGVMLDVKSGLDDPAFVRRIEDLVVDAGLADSALSFSANETTRLTWQHIVLTPTKAQMAGLRGGADVDLGGTFWFGLPADLTDEDVARLKDAGALVLPAINTFRYAPGEDRARAEADIRRLWAAGVDGFQIDSVYADLVPSPRR